VLPSSLVLSHPPPSPANTPSRCRFPPQQIDCLLRTAHQHHLNNPPHLRRLSKAVVMTSYLTSPTFILGYSTLALATLIAGYATFTGSGTQFNPGSFFEQISPYAWAMTGVGLNIGLSVFGAGWYVPFSSLSSPFYTDGKKTPLRFFEVQKRHFVVFCFSPCRPLTRSFFAGVSGSPVLPFSERRCALLVYEQRTWSVMPLFVSRRYFFRRIEASRRRLLYLPSASH
jgi:hypothetical protein